MESTKMRFFWEGYRDMSWSDIMDMELEGKYREPGEAAAKHERMLSPSRRKCDKNDEDFSRKHEEKQRRADDLREKLLKEKAARLKLLSAKVEEVRIKRAELIERKRLHMMMKMEKARENREKTLGEIVKKARDDDQRVFEVHLIHSLEAENRSTELREDQKRKVMDAEYRRNIIVEERKASREAKERKRNFDSEKSSRLSQVSPELNENEENKAEREEIKEEKIEEISSSFSIDWSFVEDHFTKRYPLEKLSKLKCVKCQKEICNELEGMAHILSSEHFDDLPMNILTLKSELDNIQSINEEIRERSALSESTVGSKNNKKEDSASRTRKRKAKKEMNKTALIAKEERIALSRSIGGKDGQAIESWKSILTFADFRINDETAFKNLELFSKKEKPKLATAALEEFLQEYAKEEPTQESELILHSTVDAAVRVAYATLCGRVADSQNESLKDCESRLYALLLKLSDKMPKVFERVLSCPLRRLKIAFILHSRFKIESTATRTGTNVRYAMRLVANVARSVKDGQALCTLIGIPLILADFPISYLGFSHLRALLMPTLAVLLLNNEEGVALFSSKLSVFHISLFFKEVSIEKSPASAFAKVTEEITERKDWEKIREWFENVQKQQ